MDDIIGQQARSREIVDMQDCMEFCKMEELKIMGSSIRGTTSKRVQIGFFVSWIE